MSFFSNSSIAEFEAMNRGMRAYLRDPRRLQARIAIRQPFRTNQVGSCARIERRLTVIMGANESAAYSRVR